MVFEVYLDKMFSKRGNLKGLNQKNPKGHTGGRYYLYLVFIEWGEECMFALA